MGSNGLKRDAGIQAFRLNRTIEKILTIDDKENKH